MEGRPELKYHEAGLDMGWSTDPYESFRIFQGKVLQEYDAMKDRFGFTQVDSDQDIHLMQQEVREIVKQGINLAAYRRAGR